MIGLAVFFLYNIGVDSYNASIHADETVKYDSSVLHYINMNKKVNAYDYADTFKPIFGFNGVPNRSNFDIFDNEYF